MIWINMNTTKKEKEKMDDQGWHNGDLLVGDCLEKIKEIPDNTVDCVISSPPYWGLRDYGTGKWTGGKGDCNHDGVRRKTRKERGGLSEVQAGNEGGFGDECKWTANKCEDCGAIYSDEQWGSELDFKDYLDKMLTLMTEIKRILKPTGSCWINLGDSYSTQSGGMKDLADGKTTQHGKIKYTGKNDAYAVRQPKIDLKPKTRVGIPERFMIRCIDDGWLLRNHIPWVKSNAMPTSVKDRFQNKWESIFFFVKKQKYFFNLDAVREKPISDYTKVTKKNIATKMDQSGLFEDKIIEGAEPWPRGNQQPEGRSHFGTGGDIKKNMERKWEKDMGQNTQTIAKTHSGNFDKDGNLIGNPKGKNPGDVFLESDKKQDNVPGPNANTYKGFNERYRKQKEVPGQSTQGIHRNRDVGLPDWDYSKKYIQLDDSPDSNKSIQTRMAAARGGGANHDGCLNDPKGKNPGDVIVDKSKPYAVVERYGTVYYRNLPAHDEIREYLQKKRDLSHLTIESIETIFGTQAPHHWFEKDGSYPTREDWIKLKQIFGFGDKYDEVMTTLYEKPAEKMDDPKGKNPGDVFNINPKPFIEAHFATFPEELPERIIKCAVPEKVCKKCGVPAENIMEATEEYAEYLGKGWHDHSKDKEQGMQQPMQKASVTASYEKVGEKTCKCDAGFEPGVVFDPFMGSGTVALVALKLNRRWLGIELNPEYVEIIRKRLLPQKNVSMDSFV